MENAARSITEEEKLYQDNVELSRAEYLLQHLHLHSRPRCLGLVLSNRCNIGCVHCYQSKNGDSLLSPPEIGRELRRELTAFYPYLSTLRLQGGELFVIPGFEELLEDVAASVTRPIVSISTNGTLIDDAWAERIVRTPLQSVTVSIDGGTPETYAKLRRGGTLAPVLHGMRRMRWWKEKLGSEFPYVNSFFVIMRSNFREIPRYLDLMYEHGVLELCLQTVEINRENSSRTPTLAGDEVVASRGEVRELHALLAACLPGARERFRMIRLSGLTCLFQEHGLDCAFLDEAASGLYPDSDDLQAGGFELCPNPWTTLFVVENGDVHLCFLAEPIGNVYEDSLLSIWNSQPALVKRSQMAAGRYLASGCSQQWCSWREGQTATAPGGASTREMLVQIRRLREHAEPVPQTRMVPSEIAPVRRTLLSHKRRIVELEGLFQELVETNSQFHSRGQDHIDALEAELETYRKSRSAQAGLTLSRAWNQLKRRAIKSN